ncbi:hypothetical protein GCM10010439_31740 [Actinocorallia aurantiaca]|uniref:RNA polymerase sigma-70 region 2 domain-containing protein n=1 Tax=Actinocorallia aurantiaca TaxID=46204 RepID=A0ABN3UAC9_9ACTN
MDSAERFTALYDECHPKVFAYAVTVAGRALAEEVAGETFCIAWRRFSDLRAWAGHGEHRHGSGEGQGAAAQMPPRWAFPLLPEGGDRSHQVRRTLRPWRSPPPTGKEVWLVAIRVPGRCRTRVRRAPPGRDGTRVTGGGAPRPVGWRVEGRGREGAGWDGAGAAGARRRGSRPWGWR